MHNVSGCFLRPKLSFQVQQNKWLHEDLQDLDLDFLLPEKSSMIVGISVGPVRGIQLIGRPALPLSLTRPTSFCAVSYIVMTATTSDQEVPRRYDFMPHQKHIQASKRTLRSRGRSVSLTSPRGEISTTVKTMLVM